MARRLSMTPQAIAKREKRAAEKAAARAALESGGELPAQPEIEVVAAPPEPAKSLKERVLGFIKPDEPAKKTRAKKDNLVTAALPTVLASFIATYSQQLLQPAYRRCAPQQEEVAAILAPIMAIIGRRVEIIGKASQDAIDLANALLAAIMYSTRAAVTYMDIKRSEHEESQPAASTNRGNAGQTEAFRTARFGTDRSAAAGELEAEGVDSEYVAGYRGDASPAAGGEADLIAAMLQRDRTGRIGLGLLPGTLPGPNGHIDTAANR